MSGNGSITIIEGMELNGFLIQLANITPGRFKEETNFECYIRTIDGEVSQDFVVRGKYFSGRGEFYKPWIDIYYFDHASFGQSGTLHLSERGFDKKLFATLTSLLPAGAHFMVVYNNHEETREGLERGYPPPATQIGYLLWKSGCTWFKDWYFAEGFAEGDVKLQGDKPLDEQNRRNDLLRTHRELADFLKSEKDRASQKTIERAREVFGDIEKELSGDSTRLHGLSVASSSSRQEETT
jgi:hypothetical protein